MDPGGIGGAFGGVKAGGQQDPLTYVKRPAVVIRIFALVSKNFLKNSNLGFIDPNTQIFSGYMKSLLIEHNWVLN